MNTTLCNVNRIDKGDIIIHMFTSPEEGESVNSHIVETASSLLIVDVPLLKPYALEFKAYIESLDKPVELVLATHAHPDHWFSLGYFSEYRIRAYQGAIDEMAMLKDVAIGFHTSIHADLMPENIILPPETIEPGDFEIGGVIFRLLQFKDIEANTLMAVEIPSINTLIAQDLVYNKCHMYVATRTADGGFAVGNWIRALEDCRTRGYETVIPGHGAAADARVFDDCIQYLTFASDVLATAVSAEEFAAAMKKQYPDHAIELMLTMSGYMIYQAGSN